MVEIDLSILRSAAQIRAATGLKTPDSLQLAAALTAGCRVFLTNDRDFPPLGSLRILRLDRYLTRN
jgi:predicted nucleic acid-binding protein